MLICILGSRLSVNKVDTMEKEEKVKTKKISLSFGLKLNGFQNLLF